MSQTLKPYYVVLTNYTQAEEDSFAATLTGREYGWANIYNTDLQRARIWNGTAFATIPDIDSNMIPNAAVLAKVLTGYSSGSGTITAADTILQAIQKLNGNDALKAPLISPSFTTPVIGVATGTSLALTGAITSNGAGIGYATGAGGTVSQGTNRTTGVTLNKLCGNITMFSAAQASQALVTFTLTNSFIAATDYLLVQHISATNGGGWAISTVCGAGSATINIRNVTAASITEATPLRFTLIKSVTS